MTVSKSYFLCFTVRSGSTLLSQLLSDTGIAGHPQEHFYHNIGPENPAGDRIPDYGRFVEETLERGSTPNGVFGSKIGGGYWHDFASRLRGIEGMRAHSLQQALDRYFPALRYIHLTRRNKVRQAVSHWMAIQSGRWHSTDSLRERNPKYDFAAIDHLLQEIVIRDAVWAEYFAGNCIKPKVIIYEDFVQDLHGTLVGILRFLDIDLPSELELPSPRYEGLAGDLSEEWLQRFRREKQSGWWRQFW